MPPKRPGDVELEQNLDAADASRILHSPVSASVARPSPSSDAAPRCSPFSLRRGFRHRLHRTALLGERRLT